MEKKKLFEMLKLPKISREQKIRFEMKRTRTECNLRENYEDENGALSRIISTPENISKTFLFKVLLLYQKALKVFAGEEFMASVS